MKINISIDDALLQRVDAYADANYMSRSGFISLACAQFLNQNEALISLGEMANAFRKMVETGTITDEDRKNLLYLETLVSSYKQ